MKKNLFSFIGACLGAIAVFFIGAEFVNDGGSHSTDLVIDALAGDYMLTQNITVWLLNCALIVAFAALAVVVIGICKGKDVNKTVFALSTFNLFATVYTFIWMSIQIADWNRALLEGESKCAVGFGLVAIWLLFIAFFALSLVGLILSALSQKGGKKEAKDDEKYAKIYQFKKMLDDGILTQEEFDTKKKELLL